MSPALKQIHRKMSREFYHNRKSQKYKILKSKFKRMKRKSMNSFYSEFVSELKLSDPGKWYAQAKKIGAVDQMAQGDIKVESLAGFSNLQSANIIAEHFAAISNQYLPIDNTQLPCFLPALPPPQVSEYDVYLRLRNAKKTKSTLPLDLPDKIRQECAPLLAGPLQTIINSCLTQSVYPADWKLEWVTPGPKTLDPKVIIDLRKISSTSDYRSGSWRTYMGNPGYWSIWWTTRDGNRAHVGLSDRQSTKITGQKSRQISSYHDWSGAFDRQDPTKGIQKFIQLGVRPSLIPLLVSYLTNRKMKVKFNGELSGTLLGQLEYLV